MLEMGHEQGDGAEAWALGFKSPVVCDGFGRVLLLEVHDNRGIHRRLALC